jgi:hypothetical protein
LDKPSQVQLLSTRQLIFDVNPEVVAYELLFRKLEPLGFFLNSVRDVHLFVIQGPSHLGDDLGLL